MRLSLCMERNVYYMFCDGVRRTDDHDVERFDEELSGRFRFALY